MANITLTPPPSISSSAITVSVEADSNVDYLIITEDGNTPAQSEYIGYDTLTPPNPFLAVTQDGRGNVVYDGGFPKFYNNNHTYITGSSTFNDLNASAKFLYNAINWCHNPDKPKKILFLGDSDIGDNYSIKGTATSGFVTTFTDISRIVGFESEFASRADFGGTINFNYSYLDEFSVILVMSSVYTDAILISNTAILNLVNYREAGNGLIFVTDHGTNDGSSGFFKTANLVISNFGAMFKGNLDRSPVNVGFLRSNYGDHPLYNNMLDSEDIYAGASESAITCTIYPTIPANSIPDIEITDTGYTILKFLIKNNDGSISFSNYTYGINVDSLLEFKSEEGNIISSLPATIINHNKIYFKAYNRLFESIDGYIKVNTDIVGTFSCSADSETHNWYTGHNSVRLEPNDQITIQVINPIEYVTTLSTNRYKPLIADMMSTGKIEQALNKYEFATSSFDGALTEQFKANSIHYKNTLINAKNYIYDTSEVISKIISNETFFNVITGKSITIPNVNILVNSIDNESQGQDPLIIDSISNVKNGTAVLNSTSVTFTASGSIGAPASFTVNVINSNNTITKTLVHMNIVAVPDIIAIADTFDLQQSETLLLSKSALSDNDEDPGGNYPLSVITVQEAINGTVTLNGDNVSFVHTGLFGEPAGFKYTVENNIGKVAVGDVNINITELPPVEGLIYNTPSEAQAAIDSIVPDSPQVLFDTWARIDGKNYFANKDSASGQALDWQLLSSPSRVLMPTNTGSLNGFISPNQYDNFTFESTLNSTSQDDDTIGVIAAFNRDNNVNNVLAIVRTQGGQSPNNGWGVYTQINGTTTHLFNINQGGVNKNSTSGDQKGWNNRSSRVKIQRQGNIIKCYCTNWNDTNNFQISSEIILNLDTESSLNVFRGAQSYGYATWSQANSTYLNNTLTGAGDFTKIVDLENNKVWEYDESAGAWVESSQTIQDIYGYVRTVTNPNTGDSYLIKEFTVEKL